MANHAQRNQLQRRGEARRRRGPVPLEADSWDAEPVPFTPAAPRARSTRRTSLGAALVVGLLLTGVVGGTWLLAGRHSGEENESGSDWSGDTSSTRGGDSAIDRARATQLPAVGASGSAQPSLSASAATATSTGGGAGPNLGGDGPSATAPSTPTGPVVVLDTEAEAGLPRIWTHSTSVIQAAGASGGAVVRFDTNGALELRMLSLEISGRYKLTIVYARDPELAAATVQVSVDGGPPAVIDFPIAGCCASSTVDLTLPLDTRAITIAGGAAWSPTIDRLTLTSLPT